MKIRLPFRKAGPPLKRPPKLKLRASVARSRRAPLVEEEDFLEEPEPNMKLSHAFVVVLVLHVIAVAGVFTFNSINAKQADIFSALKEEPAKTADAPAAAAANAAKTTEPEVADPSNGLTAPTAASPAVAPGAAAGKTYELQSGETLTKVAATYGVSVADLQSANNITDPKTIRAGTVLVIPGAAAAPAKPETPAYKPISVPPAAAVNPAPAVAVPVKTVAAAAPADAAAGSVKDSGKVYVVVKGDNPWKIAKRMKVKYAELLSLNNITDPNHIQIGQKLKIPAAAK
ncbi:MAG: LysM peptidoglycan-binding domain-containing protein [Chthoniobacterales bacterium]